MPVSYNSAANMASREKGLTVRTCKERSWAMTLLQVLIRPARPSLIKPGPVQPPGSPRLSVPGKVHKYCQVGERQVNKVWLYDLTCRPNKQKRTTHGKSNQAVQDDQKKKRHIYYFAGGGWRDPPSGNHWKLVNELARSLSDTIVTVVSCPLAPNSPASVTLPQLRELYDTVMQESKNKGERAILAGDSSGGNIVLSLATWSASGEGRGVVPAAVMAISPTTDLRHAEPQIHAVAKKDPIHTIATINATARTWYHSNSKPEAAHTGNATEAGGPLTTADDPAISPLLASLEPLAEKQVKVHGVTGSYDILAPEAVLFREKCREAGVVGEWLDWDKQMHCFPLAFSYGLRESAQGLAWIIDVLQRT
ncbi:Esterase [Paramyrothecium foliicola]|nr:Esterase [Paramyrothecium foliicola]